MLAAQLRHLGASRETLERLLALALEAKAASTSAYLREREARAAAETALAEERDAAAFYAAQLDDAMGLLERLAGAELPELVRLRADLKKRMRALVEATQRDRARRQANRMGPLEELTARARAGLEKREALVAEAASKGISRATFFRHLKAQGLTKPKERRGIGRSR